MSEYAEQMQKYDALQCRLSAERKAKYIKLAKENYRDEGTIEFDDSPSVSWVGDDDGERGAYVAAWVWVDALDIEATP